MIDALIVSNAILWVVVILLGLVTMALVRQIGILYERIAPVGALVIDKGPKVGGRAPLFELRDLSGRIVKIGGIHPDSSSTLLFFLSPTCPVCKQLLPVLKSIQRSESALDIVLASDGDRGEQEAFITRENLAQFPYVLSQELGMTFHIGKLPYAVLLDPEGVIRAKGLVNTREHLESLFEAKEAGVASVQEYLKARQSV